MMVIVPAIAVFYTTTVDDSFVGEYVNNLLNLKVKWVGGGWTFIFQISEHYNHGNQNPYIYQ